MKYSLYRIGHRLTDAKTTEADDFKPYRQARLLGLSRVSYAYHLPGLPVHAVTVRAFAYEILTAALVAAQLVRRIRLPVSRVSEETVDALFAPLGCK